MALTQTIQILLPEFQSFLALVTRIGGLLAALPILSGRTVPMKVKVALVLVLVRLRSTPSTKARGRPSPMRAAAVLRRRSVS